MRRVLWAWFVVLAVMYLVPFLVYGPASALGWVEIPVPEAPGRFVVSVLATKVSLATGFVGVFFVGRSVFGARWLTYAAVWWLMFGLGEVGSALAGQYGWGEAMAGILAEAIYVPASAYLAKRILGSPGGSTP
jgi:hypothetical protein